MSAQQLAPILASLPDAVITCDRDGKLLFINAAAITLFEVSPERSWLGIPYWEFLQRHEWYNEQQQSILFAPWLLDAIINETDPLYLYEQILILVGPSGRKIAFDLCCSPLLNAQRQMVGMIATFHLLTPRYQRALQIQRVSEAVKALNEAIMQIPEELYFAFPTETSLLAPPVLFISQPLVDVIHQALDCWRVSLIALETPQEYMYFIAGSGFTPEQEQRYREVGGRFSSLDVVDTTVFNRLHANQEVILSADQLHLPPGYPVVFGAAKLLFIPLFLEQRQAGTLSIVKKGGDSDYEQEEIDLVKAVATQAVLVIECLSYLQEQASIQARELVLYEVSRLSKEFLTLASHELRTPLTGIKGNLQLAQRRLEALKREIAEQPGHAAEHLERTQQSLASAAQSTRVQERIIQDIIDDARIQTHQLHLLLKPCDLLSLLQEAITRQRELVPDCTLLLENLTGASTIPVLADASRITQVLNIYLANAIDRSSAGQPVTVQIHKENTIVRVSVHNEGPGITEEEQQYLWDRFYRGKGSSVQHELDLSLGLSFYLCRELIKRHHGSVGVESKPNRGATFWFTLPIATA